MNHSLYQMEKHLRAMAKRYKSIPFSTGLAIVFLMLGMKAFAEDIVTEQAVLMTRPEIGQSLESMETKVKELRSKNNKVWSGVKLELIQLMEQGDQVVKSPWVSWQFGMNYMYNNWRGTYKGRGDKKEKYPYEGIFTRSKSIFGRATTVRTENQETLKEILNGLGELQQNPKSAININRTEDLTKYGLLERKKVEELPYGVNIGAEIHPRLVNKTAPHVEIPQINISTPTPSTAPTPPSAPGAPNIYIPGFSPVAPKVEAPVLPDPPTFAVILGADCNNDCSSNANPRQEGQGKSEKYPGKQNLNAFLHYTWTDGDVPDPETKGLAFKMYAETNSSSDFILGKTRPTQKNAEILDTKNWYFNSYNTGTEFKNPIKNSYLSDNEKNHQPFFVGGSRFIEADNARTDVNNRTKIEIPNGHTVHLGGILTLALVSQGDATYQLNSGKITDIEENEDEYIKNLQYDDSGDGKNKYKTIIGPGTAKYKIKRSNDGYVGYKVGIALVQEQSSYTGILENKGVIDFRGERSIGEYIYLPIQKSQAKMLNSRGIQLSGKESYGMKIAAKSGDDAEMLNATDGAIILRKNPNGVDKADNSAAMALMSDGSVRYKVSLGIGKAVNKGTINLEDNISNALGMFVNIDSDMTNEGKINISAIAEKENNKYKLNVGMRATQVETAFSTASTFDTKVLNKKEINLSGEGAIGMIAQGKTTVGTARGVNTGKINITAGEGNFGMFSSEEAEVTNETAGQILIGTSPNSVGMVSLKDKENNKFSTAINKGTIEITGENSTAVYNTGHFSMGEGSITVDGKQSIGLYSRDRHALTKTNITGGTITAKNGGVGLYSDKANIILDNSGNNLNLVSDNGGLLFYNYESESPTVDSGQFTLTGTVNSSIKSGGTAFYLKNATISNITNDVSDFVNRMFEPTENPLGGKLVVNMKSNGTFIILHKPQGGNLELSRIPSTSGTGSITYGKYVTLNTAGATDGYKMYSVYRGGLSIDKAVNLDDATDNIYKVEFLSSNVTVEPNQKIEGTKPGQAAIFQSNYDEGTEVGTVSDVKVVNKGTIVLKGDFDTANNKTTTAMAGDFITLINRGKIEVLGNKSVGIYGAGGSKITNDTNASITLGEGGVALFGANKLGTSALGDNTISIENKGKIKGINGKTQSFGIYAHKDMINFPAVASTINNSGEIDFSMTKESVGIDVADSDLTNTGIIKLADKGVAINAEQSNVTSSGDITLENEGIAFNLSKDFTGKALNITSKVTLNGTKNSVYNLKNSTLDSASLQDNVVLTAPNGDYSYFSLDKSKLTYANAKSLTGDKIVLVNGKQSSVEWNGDVTLTGKENVAFYMDTQATYAGVEVKTAAGKTITLSGDKSAAIYAKNGARVENNANIVMGKEGVALYSSGGSLKNTGTLTLGENTVGMYLDSGNMIQHTGTITSTEKNAKGIVVKKNAPMSFKNEGIINLTGPEVVGVYAEGAAHTFENEGDITVGDTADGQKQSIGVFAKDDTKVINRKNILAGKQSIGIYGTHVETENNSKIEVGDGAIGIFSHTGTVNLKAGSSMKIGKSLGDGKEAVGLFYNGSGAALTNELSSLDIGEGSIGIFVGGDNNTLSNNLANVTLRKGTIYTYGTDKTGTIHGNTKINTNGSSVYGYYVAGNLNNTADIDLTGGAGNVGIYNAYATGSSGIAKNSGKITVGASDVDNKLYGIGMAAGYIDHENHDPSKTRIGSIENTGIIDVTSENSIGMYATGIGSKAVNKGTINVKAPKAIGMYIDNGAIGENASTGNIILEVGADNSIGAYVGRDSIFKNYGTIEIRSNNSKGILKLKNSTVELAGGNITDRGTGNKTLHEVSNASGEKVFGDITLKVHNNISPETDVYVNGIKTPKTNINISDPANPRDSVIVNPAKPLASIEYSKNPFKDLMNLGEASKIGMYVDTSGVNFTNPIQGLQHLSSLKKADLIVGAEAGEYTNSRVISIGDKILARYNKAILNSPNIEKWEIISGALNWAAAPGELNPDGTFKSVILTKADYKEYVGNDKSNNAYNFLAGLEQRYGMNALDSREKQVFNKLNGIGKLEEVLFSQAIDEMMGHQYANVQQRIQATGSILDQEFKYLKKEWDTKSKDSNKLKAFGMRGEYNTDTAGIIDYTNHAQGFAYLHENESIQLGNTTGWYTGLIHNELKFKDIGKSKEEMLQAKLGVFKSTAFDHNNSLNWTISGEIFVGRNRMRRKYLVVNDIFQAKSRYWSYGFGVNNEVSKTFRTSEATFVKPYGELKLEYGRFQKIKEKDGEVRLEVKANDYYSIKPEIGLEAGYKYDLANRKTFTARVGVSYSNELGEVAKGKNKARVAYTNADWFHIRGEKEDRRGNLKTELHLGLDNEAYGVSANIGYDTKGQNVRGGLGLRVIF